MSARVRVRSDGDGRAVAVKVATNPATTAALVREAAVLSAIRRPGVVALVGLAHGADGLELLTDWVGTGSLADAAPRPPLEAARIVAGVASVLAGLHAEGIVHGCLEASHVLLDAHGRPVLCSFAGATLPATAAPGAAVGRPADDVAGLGALLVDVLGPVPEPDLGWSPRPPSRIDNQLHRGLLVLADHARADDPSVRPTAAAFRAAVLDLAPGARETRATRTDDLERLRATSSGPQRRRRGSRAVAALVLAALVLAALVGAGLLGAGLVAQVDGATADRVEPSPTPLAERVAAPVTSIVPARSTSAASTPPPGPADAQVPVVDVAGVRYEVGVAGDVAATARWRCEAATDVVLLRPRTGDLYLFPDPSGSTTPPPALPFGSVAGGVAIEPADPDDPCPVPVVVRADGTALPIGVPVA